MRPPGIRLSICLALGLAGCSKQPAPAPSGSASAAVSAAPPVTSRASTAPSAEHQSASWYTGAWHGSYEAQRYAIEAPKNEGAREWKDDDGGPHSGDGQIALEVDEAGAIRGTASGPLGEQVIGGEVDGNSFRVRFRPKQPGAHAFTGFAVLRQQGSALKGRLQSASGDSLTARDALVELSKGKAGAPTPAASASD